MLTILFSALLNFAYLLKDNMQLFDYNVQDRVNDFVAAALLQVSLASLSSNCWRSYMTFVIQEHV